MSILLLDEQSWSDDLSVGVGVASDDLSVGVGVASDDLSVVVVDVEESEFSSVGALEHW
eukprot:CAMPEP_0198303402 /NCGR_PEP_ID=MMETSP1449-20131203/56871_1 /TAXON_ID=420275 /ORGANISM="Attheya septentrionalis, Strain CCMP2084" /LENGTH=58 /DNA_ID=CAMNT_0044005897 /DNA_START=543 /DNA_END=717 /DNA_ORIENTATION=+